MDAKAYNSLVEAQADAVYRFILKCIKHSDDAQDIVQDAFEKVWINKENINREKAKSYLFSTAYHTMIDRIRKVKRISALEKEHEYVQYFNEEYTGTTEMINNAVNQLPPDQRSVILLRDYEGYAYDEIGAITGLSESQVKVYIHRARTFLRNYIEKTESYCHGNK
jgi:RNA polymerase sigma-70 factor (ECF subfamily)